MPTRKFTFSTEEEFTRFVKEDLLYPCVLSMSFPRTEQEMKDPYFRNKGETRSISFEQWEGSWGHQSEKYILLARDIYSPLGVVMGRLGKGVALFEITVIEFDREEYVKFVTGRRGTKGFRQRMHAATPGEIREEWDNVREDHECYKEDPLVKENNMSYEEWYSEINWPTKYEPKWEQEKKEMWDEEMAKYNEKEEVANG